MADPLPVSRRGEGSKQTFDGVGCRGCGCSREQELDLDGSAHPGECIMCNPLGMRAGRLRLILLGVLSLRLTLPPGYF